MSNKIDLEGYNKIADSEIRKLEKIGDYIKGKFLNIEPSAKFTDGYALHFTDYETEKAEVVFVSKIVKDKLERARVVIDSEIVVIYSGNQKNSKGLEYKLYDVYVK